MNRSILLMIGLRNNKEERRRHVSLTNTRDCSGPVSENGQSVSGEIPLGTLASRHGQYQ
jgi:hypothetical protein